jgi:hypothetical protein
MVDMMRVSSWEDNDVIKREVKSCDNHDLGEIQEVNRSYLIVKKGAKINRVPRAAVATFDGDKVYLRATEAEVLAGVYPFRDSSGWDEDASSSENRPMNPPTPQPTLP